MSNMFAGASNFNQPLNGWDVGEVTWMDFMFYGASNFNQPLNGWDVGEVTWMEFMFYGASKFNQDLCPWGKFPSFPYGIKVDSMFRDSGCTNQASPTSSSGLFCAVATCPSA
jgi:surface protein